MNSGLERPSFLDNKDPNWLDDIIFKYLNVWYPTDGMLFWWSIIAPWDQSLLIARWMGEKIEEILQEKWKYRFQAFNPARKKISRHANDIIVWKNIFFSPNIFIPWTVATLRWLVQNGILIKMSNWQALENLWVTSQVLWKTRLNIETEVYFVPEDQSLNVAVADMPPRTFEFS